MNTDVRELYQEVLLDHGRRPRNRRRPDRIDRRVEGDNPLCGDNITLYLEVEDGVISDASFEGEGCAISTASASMMTEAVKGKSIDQAAELHDSFHDMLTGVNGNGSNGIGKLAVFAGVKEFPVRVKCATLAWHSLKAALDNDRSNVSTE
jgi:nitrogen fixation NifU-like protein